MDYAFSFLQSYPRAWSWGIHIESLTCLKGVHRSLSKDQTILKQYLYLQWDDLQGWVRAHRAKEGKRNASFLYFLVRGKSMVCQLETLLIYQFLNHGFKLTNVADGQHQNFGEVNVVLLCVDQGTPTPVSARKNSSMKAQHGKSNL
ncbi:hypothetical protein Tco_0790370 [Tanacetum coccineum]